MGGARAYTLHATYSPFISSLPTHLPVSSPLPSQPTHPASTFPPLTPQGISCLCPIETQILCLRIT
jgi:hypothetical protein